MEITAFHDFLVVAEYLHFGKAADALDIAQSALSVRIKALEHRLGVRLFDRTTRSVTLTEAGQVFAIEARRLVNMTERAIRVTQAAQVGEAGDLHIGYGGSVVFEPKVRTLLRTFRKTYPDVSVSMHECTVKEQLEGLSTGKLDVALLWGPLGNAYREISGTVFLRSSLSAVLPAEHSMAKRKQVSIEDLHSEPFISLMDPPGMGMGYIIEKLFDTAGSAPNIALHVSSLMSVIGLAGAGFGVGIVPDLPFGVTAPAFVMKPLKGVDAQAEIVITTLKRPPSILVTNFVKMAAAL